MQPLKPEDAAQSSPLDNPLNSTYVRVIVIEVVVIVLLFILGRMFR